MMVLYLYFAKKVQINGKESNKKSIQEQSNSMKDGLNGLSNIQSLQIKRLSLLSFTLGPIKKMKSF